ncbi:MAG: hypothetical protein IPL40_01970 [Proteobacteria bacterium]|nr:hypothetical protein [Pseudomonadota bacterium]
MRGLHTVAAYIRSKHPERWLAAYLRQRLCAWRERLPAHGERHLLVAVCDHFEPLWAADDAWAAVPDEVGAARVKAWHEGLPRLAAGYRDSEGRAPRHTFFFPAEQYRPQFLQSLADLARAGLGEVELHLHHDGDTAAGLRRVIAAALKRFATHGHLARAPDGRPRYAFIHGDWALANAREDGRRCGVDDELAVLAETGCYADFTFPAAPDECQPPICNQIYWPTGDLTRRRAHHFGERARVGRWHEDRPLLIQGPLALALRARRMPLQLDNADLTHAFVATPARVRTWVAQHVHVAGRPEWVFVKLHTHGAPEDTSASLLGEGGHALHRALSAAGQGRGAWRLHYVTAREMFNLARAAMEGCRGNPARYRDHVLAPPPVVARTGC